MATTTPRAALRAETIAACTSLRVKAKGCLELPRITSISFRHSLALQMLGQRFGWGVAQGHGPLPVSPFNLELSATN
eukprot:2613432-Pyramimonas_sp.AAC.1